MGYGDMEVWGMEIRKYGEWSMELLSNYGSMGYGIMKEKDGRM